MDETFEEWTARHLDQSLACITQISDATEYIHPTRGTYIDPSLAIEASECGTQFIPMQAAFSTQFENYVSILTTTSQADDGIGGDHTQQQQVLVKQLFEKAGAYLDACLSKAQQKVQNYDSKNLGYAEHPVINMSEYNKKASITPDIILSIMTRYVQKIKRIIAYLNSTAPTSNSGGGHVAIANGSVFSEIFVGILVYPKVYVALVAICEMAMDYYMVGSPQKANELLKKVVEHSFLQTR